MGDRVSANPARSRVGRRADGRKRPPDFADSDIVDAILAEVEWEDEGNPDAALDGWCPTDGRRLRVILLETTRTQGAWRHLGGVIV